MRIAVLLALSLTACSVSFDMPVAQAPHLTSGRVHDTTGEVVDVPEELEAEVHLDVGDGHRVMAPSFAPPGTPVRAFAVPREQLNAAETAGWIESELVFERPSDVMVQGTMLYVRRENGQIVAMPVGYVDHIEVTDTRMRRDQTIIIVIASVAGGAALIGGLAYGFSQLSFY